MLGLISVLRIICNVLKFKTIHSHYASFIFFNCLLDWLTDWLMRKTGHFLQLRITKWLMNTTLTSYLSDKGLALRIWFRLGVLRRIPSNSVDLCNRQGRCSLTFYNQYNPIFVLKKGRRGVNVWASEDHMTYLFWRVSNVNKLPQTLLS